jgi:S-adenosylmethionine synthetase
MTIENGIFTSEAVAGGHPDKLCDQISDAVLDACLADEPVSRVAIETAIKDHTVCLFGEITSKANPDFDTIVRTVLQNNGHIERRWGLDVDRICLIRNVSKQSTEIASGVDGMNMGAGDQGIMFGYANADTSSLMPAPIDFANRLAVSKETDLRRV